MRLMIGTTYLVICILIIIWIYIKKSDLFHPLIIYQFLCVLRYVPHFIYGNYGFGIYINQDDCIRVFFYTLVGNFFVLGGYVLYETKIKKRVCAQKDFSSEAKEEKANIVVKQNTIKLILVISLIFLLSSFFGLQRIVKSGGIATILENTAGAYAGLSSGSGLASYLFGASMFAVALSFYCYSKKKKKIFVIISIFFTAIYGFMNIIYSSRAPVINAIILGLFLFNVYVKKINIKSLLKPKLFLIILAIIMIVQIGPVIRKKSFSEIAVSDFFQINDNFDSAFLDQFSYVERDALTYRYFNNNYWLGGTYLRVFTSIIPSKVYPNKPPVDDGIYLSHILAGGNTNGMEGRNSLITKFSIPFSTNGIMYANFGAIGIILGNLFIGVLYGKLYKINIKEKDPLISAFYFYTIWNLTLTVSFVFSLLVTYCIYKIYYEFFILCLRVKWK